jgi:hypothetical protein
MRRRQMFYRLFIGSLRWSGDAWSDASGTQIRVQGDVKPMLHLGKLEVLFA